MFLGTEQQRQTGLRHIAHLKDTHFSDKRNKVENIFDNAPDKWKTTCVFMPVLNAAMFIFRMPI